MHRQIITTEAFPSAEKILYDEMATVLAEVDKFGFYFRSHFVPNPKQKELHDYYWGQDDGKLLIVLLYGGTGSGKSVAALSLVMDLLSRFPDTRALGVRHTYDELMDSVFEATESFLKKYRFPYLSKKDPPGFTFPNGSKFLLRSERSTVKPSDKGAKASSLGSTEYSIAYLEEADGISERFFLTVVGRMRQGTLPRPIIILVCNPPTEDHWIYRVFWKNGLQGRKTHKIHVPIEDNRKNLREGYIEDLEEILAAYPTLYKKFRLGLPGPDARGRPIFQGIFRRDLHVAKKPIEWDPRFPLYRMWDPGWRRPAVLIAQDNLSTGQITFLYAKHGHEQILRSFAQREIQIHKNLFPDAKWKDIADVASRQRRSNSPKSDLDVLRGLGLNVTTEYSLIDYGVALWQDLLCTMLPATPDFPGGPAILIDPVRCSVLIDALEFGYCQDETAKKDELRPVKDGYYDHIMDCSRYFLVQVRTLEARKVPKRMERKLWRPYEPGRDYEARPVDLKKLFGRGGRIASYGFNRRKRGH
jgi:hypothetical protein